MPSKGSHLLVLSSLFLLLGAALATNQRRSRGANSPSGVIDFDSRIAIVPDAIEAVYEDSLYTPGNNRKPILHHHRDYRHVIESLAVQGRTHSSFLKREPVPITANAIINWFQISYDTSVPGVVQSVIEEATEIWSDILNDIVVPIHVSVSWSALPTNTLGSAGPSFVYLYSGDQLYYCDAQINQIAGSDVDPSTPDIVVTLNSQFAGWHYDTETPPPSGKHDLLTVVLHELFHGIGMIGLVSNDGQYLTDSTYVYDTFLVDSLGEPIVDAESKANSNVMLERVTSDEVYFRIKNGNNTVLDNPRIYAPTSFSSGSSLYHFDETTYAPGSYLALMTPSLNSQERLLDIGHTGYDVLDTIGWSVRNCSDYSSNCHVCTMASCGWMPSTGECVSTMGDAVVVDEQECDACSNSQECDDTQDLCRSGSCDPVSQQCVYESVICDDGRECTTSLCDSSIGCVHLDIDGHCHLEESCAALRSRDLWVASPRVELPIFNTGFRHYALQSNATSPLASVDRVTIYLSFDAPENAIVTAQVQCGGTKVQLIEAQYLEQGPYRLFFDDEAFESILSVSSPSSADYKPTESLVSTFYRRALDESTCTLALRGDVTLNDVQFRIETQDPLDLAQSLSGTDDDACALCAERDIILTETLPFEAVWNVGGDLPALPAEFFGTGSERVDDRDISFTWCGKHVRIERTSDVLLRYQSNDTAVYLGEVRDFRLCALRTFNVSYADERDDEQWTVEAQVSTGEVSQNHATVTMNAISCAHGMAEVELFATMSFTFYHHESSTIRHIDPGTLLELFYHPTMRWHRIGGSHQLAIFL